MDFFKGKIGTYTLAFGLIISSIVGWGVYHIHPSFNWNWFFISALFFLIIETALVVFIASASLHSDKKHLVNLYLLTKVIKLVASLFFIGIYILMTKEDITAFITVFISFYLLYLTIETILFLRIEKNLKEKKNE